MQQLTAHQIIDETVAFYGEDLSRRAKDEKGYCEYKMPGGRMCAFGRVMIPQLLENNCWIGVIKDVLRDMEIPCNDKTIVTNPLQPQYWGQTVDFWSDIQLLHDTDTYWNFEKGGLSEYGKIYVKELKEKFKN